VIISYLSRTFSATVSYRYVHEATGRRTRRLTALRIGVPSGRTRQTGIIVEAIVIVVLVAYDGIVPKKEGRAEAITL